MLTFSLLLLCCGLLVSAQEKHVRISVVHHKREAVTCEQNYGEGSQSCGGEGSTYCFNPKIGQSCCAADNGFCDSGKYCAPVAGYCCLEGEDLETCARNAGFTLPGSASNTTAGPQVVANVTTIAGPTITVLPFLKESATPVPKKVDVQNNSCSFATPANVNKPVPVPTLISHTNATAPLTVQVSSAIKRAEISTGPMTLLSLLSILAIVLLELVISPR
ncbi:uncharacterized protein F4812DRAFT_458421 [Daldinia caldariorum]|uniref:uncharacterized protein n=1 Tax=Daldinia caldariorum TaxID=326644 RepID=UPI0020084181|nr:uncharacterized protein F4812DRAFT_458421 [Daldinia caldariorum]KAI1468895.1 hypothetical protein F4812DRAFT_458421 [Daldinia caldariorum]